MQRNGVKGIHCRISKATMVMQMHHIDTLYIHYPPCLNEKCEAFLIECFSENTYDSLLQMARSPHQISDLHIWLMYYLSLKSLDC
jgi:hypothetical protein